VLATFAVLASCGSDVHKVKPTPRAAFGSTYPCQLLTRQMASRLLSIDAPRRVGAQTLQMPGAVKLEQCIWARGRYKAIPQVALVISPATYIWGKGQTIASRQRRAEQRPYAGYRAVRGVGDRAIFDSIDRTSTNIVVEQDGRSFELILRLRAKPRSHPPPVAALEAMAREISARYTHPPG
jgi:hypothetical protein